MVESRKVHMQRKTNETNIAVELDVDGTGVARLATGVPFLDHMLDLFARHGLFDITVTAQGDVHIDDHHTVEDIGIVLGQAFSLALGQKQGIRRYGQALIPMDEALAQVAIDLSGRGHFVWRGRWPSPWVKTFQVELVEEFLWKLAIEAKMTLHVELQTGHNTHHCVEAVFKALGRALDVATQRDPRIVGVPSTKGVL